MVEDVEEEGGKAERRGVKAQDMMMGNDSCGFGETSLNGGEEAQGTDR